MEFQMRLRFRCLAASILAVVLTNPMTLPSSAQTNTNIVVKTKQQLPADAKALLESADEFKLLSLSWSPAFAVPNLAGITNRSIRGYRIGGEVLIKPGEERTNLVNALATGIAEGNLMAYCFNPRHGIRARKGNETLECLICFECSQAYVGTNKYAISTNPAAIFNGVLRKAGIPVIEN